MGMFTKKIQCQAPYVTRRPPSVGPTAAATEPSAPQMPMAAPRWRAGNAVNRMASEMGAMAAPPTACPTRKAMSQPMLGARPQSNENTVNTLSPIRKMRFWPNLSARRPMERKKHPEREAVRVEHP